MEDELDQYDASGKSVHLLLNKLEESEVEGEKKRVPIGVVRIITAKNKVSPSFFISLSSHVALTIPAARTSSNTKTLPIIRIRQGSRHERA